MNPTSFRFPPNLEGLADKKVVEVIQNHDDAITDLQQAIPILKGQITAAQKTTTSSVTTAKTTGVTAAQANSIAVTAVKSSLGLPNNQTGTSYTPLNSDYGGIITLDNSSPVAVTLTDVATGIVPQWWTFLQNNGTGTATVTPASGTINGAGSISLATSQSAAVFFDGTNWSAATSTAGGTITAVVAGTGLVGGGASGSVTLSINTTAVTPGSYTNADLTVNAEGQITAASNGSSGSYIKGSVTVAASGMSGTFVGTGTVSGATTSMAAVASAPTLVSLCLTDQVTWACDVVSANTVEVQVTLPNVGVTWANITFNVVVFP